jgi:hypothetical protein
VCGGTIGFLRTRVNLKHDISVFEASHGMAPLAVCQKLKRLSN